MWEVALHWVVRNGTGGTDVTHIFIGIRDFYKNPNDQDMIIAMDMSEHIGFRMLTRKFIST